MNKATPEEGLGTPVKRIIRHHFRLRSPSAGNHSPTATFHWLIRSSVVDVVGTPSPNKFVYETPPTSAEWPATPASRNARVRPPWSPPWPRAQLPSQESQWRSKRQDAKSWPRKRGTGVAGSGVGSRASGAACGVGGGASGASRAGRASGTGETRAKASSSPGVLAEEGPRWSGRISHPPDRFSPNW